MYIADYFEMIRSEAASTWIPLLSERDLLSGVIIGPEQWEWCTIRSLALFFRGVDLRTKRSSNVVIFLIRPRTRKLPRCESQRFSTMYGIMCGHFFHFGERVCRNHLCRARHSSARKLKRIFFVFCLPSNMNGSFEISAPGLLELRETCSVISPVPLRSITFSSVN